MTFKIDPGLSNINPSVSLMQHRSKKEMAIGQFPRMKWRVSNPKCSISAGAPETAVSVDAFLFRNHHKVSPFFIIDIHPGSELCFLQ